MVITNDEKLYWNAKRFADRGKPFGSKNPTNLFLGLNYRMTELQAAIGRAQLKKLPARARKRGVVFKKLRKQMESLKAIKLWKIIDNAEPNPWFCFLRYEREKMKVSKKKCAQAIAAEGIPVGARYTTLMYRQNWIRDRVTYGNSHCPWSCPSSRKIDYKDCCPNAERALQDHMKLIGVHEGWSEKEIQDTTDAIKKVEEAYLR